MNQLSDEFLLAYIDGQLERRQSGEVSHLTSVNAEIARRVARLKRSQAQLIESFGAFAREEIAVPRSALQFDDSEGKQPNREKAAVRAGAQSAAHKEPDAVRKMLFVAAVFAAVLKARDVAPRTGKLAALIRHFSYASARSRPRPQC